MEYTKKTKSLIASASRLGLTSGEFARLLKFREGK